MSPTTLLRKENNYSRLFFAGIVNGIGDRFSQVALLTLLLNETGSGLAVGLALGIRVVPFLLFGPLGGYLADRISKKKILVITDLARIAFAISFVLVDYKTDLWIIYVSTFALASGEAIYAPARKSIIPLLVKKENILKINSLEQVLLGIVLIGGSFSGGIVTFFFGPDMTFWFNGLSFLFAALIIYSLPTIEAAQSTKNNRQKESTSSIFHNFKIIRKWMMVSSALSIAILFELLIPFTSGIDNVLISVYAVQEFHLGDIGVGLFYGALGIGLMLSFIIAQRIDRHLLLFGLTALLIEGTFQMILSQVHLAFLAVLLYISASFVSGISNACFDTIVMKETPIEKQGFVFGLLSTISNTLIGISMFGAGLLLEVVHNRMLGLLGGAGLAVTVLILFLVYSIKQRKLLLLSEKTT